MPEDHLSVMLDDLSSADRWVRTRAISWWAKQEAATVMDTLLPHAFRGNDNLDSGITQVMVTLGSMETNILLRTALDRLPTPISFDPGLEHTINALAKYVVPQAKHVLPIMCEAVNEETVEGPAGHILLGLLKNIAKQSKRSLRALDITPLETLVIRHRQNMAWWRPGITEIIRGVVANIFRHNQTTHAFVGDYSLELVLRRSISNDMNVPSPSQSQTWHQAFVDLAEAYRTLTTVEEADQWYEEYSLTVYRLLLDHPDAFIQGWDETAIRVSRPGSPTSSELAWRLISQNCPGTGRLSGLNRIGKAMYCRLLSHGDWRALLRFSQALDEGEEVGQKECVTLNALMAHLAGWDYFSEQITKRKIEFGNSWERLCQRAAQALYGDVVIHPRLPNGKVPDIVLKDGLQWTGSTLQKAITIIECKKSTRLIDEPTVGKYQPYCDRLVFWVLAEAPGAREPSENVVLATDLAIQVRPVDEVLADDIMALVQWYCSPDIEVELFKSGARQNGVPADIVSLVESLYLRSFPRFTELHVTRWIEPDYHR